jgi:signal peptidase II
MFYLVTLAVVTLDQASKWYVLHRLDDRPIIGDLLRLTLTENTGAAFGLFPGARAPFIVISIIAALGLAYANHTMRHGSSWRVLLALILGGNLGNLVDRIRLGHVTDFIDMGVGTTRWPVFNVADIAVVIGAAGLGLALLADMSRERRATAAATAAPEAPPLPDENSADAR